MFGFIFLLFMNININVNLVASLDVKADKAIYWKKDFTNNLTFWTVQEDLNQFDIYFLKSDAYSLERRFLVPAIIINDTKNSQDPLYKVGFPSNLLDKTQSYTEYTLQLKNKHNGIVFESQVVVRIFFPEAPSSTNYAQLKKRYVKVAYKDDYLLTWNTGKWLSPSRDKWSVSLDELPYNWIITKYRNLNTFSNDTNADRYFIMNHDGTYTLGFWIRNKRYLSNGTEYRLSYKYGDKVMLSEIICYITKEYLPPPILLKVERKKENLYLFTWRPVHSVERHGTVIGYRIYLEYQWISLGYCTEFLCFRQLPNSDIQLSLKTQKEGKYTFHVHTIGKSYRTQDFDGFSRYLLYTPPKQSTLKERERIGIAIGVMAFVMFIFVVVLFVRRKCKQRVV